MTSIDYEPIRAWEADGFRLQLWDMHRVGPYGKARLAYEFHDKDTLIFEGDDYFPSPVHTIDGDESVAGLLAFLSLRPGDTDPEWFDSYTPNQLAWCRARGEELSFWVERLENPVRYYRETESEDYLGVDPLLHREVECSLPAGNTVKAAAVRYSPL